MKVWIRDHTLCFDFGSRCFLIRPCDDLSGRFRMNGIDLPWFRLKTLVSKTGRTTWAFFAMPFLCVGMVRMSS